MKLSDQTKKLLAAAGAGVLLFFLVVMLNQLTALYQNLSAIHPLFALAVVALVALAFLALLILPIYGFTRFPKLEEPPEEQSGPAYDAYVERQYQKLKRNHFLKKTGFLWDEKAAHEAEVKRAHEVLRIESLETIKADAQAVFLTTAVSQNGVLDGLTVLYNLSRMVYRITSLYENRPSPARILQLYGQIAGTVLVARSIEDMDLIQEQIEPLMASLLGGTVFSLIPGAVGITTLLVNSVVEGSVNALLTLRVGVLTQRYLSALAQPQKSGIRRSASMEAAGMLGAIIKDNAVVVVKTFGNAAKEATKSTFGFGERKWDTLDDTAPQGITGPV